MMIIDDDDVMRSFIQNLLMGSISEYKFIFVPSDSNKSALDSLEKVNGNIDIISTDLNRPGGSGIEFIKVCKEKYPHIPIIVCTGFAPKQYLDDMKDAGLIKMYFKKPFDVHKYIQVIREILQSQKVVRPIFVPDH
ncbi:MAG TPA: response regulator [Methanoregulaceae archaeon]|jgi:DNA-binding NarL/FixJ family response regulator|nr:response regulator [Methanoregulaceae archaeon]